MAGTAGRTVCDKCGANNFETQAACWKCGTSLGGGVTPPPAPARPGNVAASPAPTVDPALAHWVGVIGGLSLPLVMLPVGFVFLMWDDKRKMEIGRTATIASLVGTVLHGVFTYFAVAGAVGAAMKFLPGMADKAKAAQSQPAPDFQSDAEPLDLGGVKPMAPAK